MKYTTGNESLGQWKQDLRDLLLGNPVGTQILVKKWNDNFPGDYTNGKNLFIMIVRYQYESSSSSPSPSPSSQPVAKYTVSKGMATEYDGDNLEEAINKVVDQLKNVGILEEEIHKKTFFFVNNP